MTVSSNIDVYPGETATFYCSAPSLETFSSTFIWEKVDLNGDLISVDNGIDSSGSGSAFDHNNMLTVNNVNFSDSGVGFYCRADGFSNSEVTYLNGRVNLLLLLYSNTKCFLLHLLFYVFEVHS